MMLRISLLVTATLAALAAYADCKPLNRFPATIDAPGHYCLDAPANVRISSGEAIFVDAGNVTLDLNGFALTNQGGADGYCPNELLDTPTVGIRISGSVANVTVRNGSVACFGRGIEGVSACDGCSIGHTIENMNVHQSGSYGIFLDAWNATVRGNHIFRTGLARGVEFAAGIQVQGSGNAIVDNDVMSVVGENSIGIGTSNGNAALIAGNRVQQTQYGFRLFGGSAVRFRDNLTAEVSRAYVGQGVDLGNND